ncbi:hypothetical protein LCGC14_0434070 [marine sediment metagenome]|uniref:Uncharacterized protein n=1 Tax=marine sediment metagenome TaxID=412755 RepID=A0A0F9T577_9ZZZZ
MNIEGTITNTAPSAAPDANQCCRQKIQITNASGTEFVGFINWKKQAYAVGMPILVEATANQDGSFYFKKINPRFAQGGNQQQGDQQWQQPPQQAQQQAYRYPDAKDIGIIRQCCIKAAARLSLNEPEEVILYARKFEAYCLGREATSQPSGSNPSYEANPDYNPNPQPTADGDGIPF